jgi:hypothetical protein
MFTENKLALKLAGMEERSQASQRGKTMPEWKKKGSIGISS